MHLPNVLNDIPQLQAKTQYINLSKNLKIKKKHRYYKTVIIVDNNKDEIYI